MVLILLVALSGIIGMCSFMVLAVSSKVLDIEKKINHEIERKINYLEEDIRSLK